MLHSGPTASGLLTMTLPPIITFQASQHTTVYGRSTDIPTLFSRQEFDFSLATHTSCPDYVGVEEGAPILAIPILATLWIIPVAVFWFFTFRLVPEKDSPFRRGVIWLKGVFPLWVMYIQHIRYRLT